MTFFLHQLEQDRAVITAILETHRTSAFEDSRPGLQILRNTYLFILEDAIQTLITMIHFLAPR